MITLSFKFCYLSNGDIKWILNAEFDVFFSHNWFKKCISESGDYFHFQNVKQYVPKTEMFEWQEISKDGDGSNLLCPRIGPNSPFSFQYIYNCSY